MSSCAQPDEGWSLWIIVRFQKILSGVNGDLLEISFDVFPIPFAGTSSLKLVGMETIHKCYLACYCLNREAKLEQARCAKRFGGI